MKKVKFITLAGALMLCLSTCFYSCGENNNSSKNGKIQSSPYKGNKEYKNGYEHGQEAKKKGHYDVDAYCSVMSNVSSLVPYPPTPAFKEGFSDGYNGRENQY